MISASADTLSGKSGKPTVYQDGRIEAAGSQLFEQYLGILAGREGWQEHFADRGVEYAVMGPDDDRGRAALRTALEVSPDWAPAYRTIRLYFVRLGGPQRAAGG